MSGHGSSTQSGATLISLLVGMLISMFAVLGALTMYRTVAYQQATGKEMASADTSMTSAVLSLQIDLQSAGFGQTNAATGNDFLLLQNATLVNGQLAGTQASLSGTEQTGNAVVWGELDDLTTYTCHALLATSSALLVLSVSAGCSSAADWASNSWSSGGSIWTPASGADLSSVFSVAKSSCWPYDVAGNNSDTHVLVTVTLPSPSDKLSQRKSTQCLPNFVS